MDEQNARDDQHVYNPLDRTTYEAIAYNAIGRASETGTYASLGLIHSTGNSGWSVGTLQWDFGQPGRGDKVNDLLAGYQAWSSDDQKFTDEQIRSLTTRMQTRGQVGNDLTSDEQAKLNAYLRSDSGRSFVNDLNQIQVDKKWNNVESHFLRLPGCNNSALLIPLRLRRSLQWPASFTIRTRLEAEISSSISRPISLRLSRRASG